MADQALFHQLRSRGRALAQGLLLVLLATWLSAVCPHCLAQAAQKMPASSAPVMSCHGDEMAAPQPDSDPSHRPGPATSDTFDHDHCPQSPACTGGDCAQLTAVAPGEPLDAVLADVYAPGFIAADFISYAFPSTPPPLRIAVPVLAAADCPLYLRHCTFLN